MDTTEKAKVVLIDPDDRISAIQPEISCRVHGAALDFKHSTIEGKGNLYSYQCKGVQECGVAFELLIPQGASLLDRLPAKQETEYHPDDGVKLSEVLFLGNEGSESSGEKLVPLVKKAQTVYGFGVRGQEPKLYVIVDHKKKGT